MSLFCAIHCHHRVPLSATLCVVDTFMLLLVPGLVIASVDAYLLTALVKLHTDYSSVYTVQMAALSGVLVSH